MTSDPLTLLAMRRRRIALWSLLALAMVVVLAIWATGLVAYRHETGYLAPVFAPDGRSVFAIERSTSGVIAGFGYEF